MCNNCKYCEPIENKLAVCNHPKGEKRKIRANKTENDYLRLPYCIKYGWFVGKTISVLEYSKLKNAELNIIIPLTTIYSNMHRDNIDTIGNRKNKKIILTDKSINWKPKYQKKT